MTGMEAALAEYFDRHHMPSLKGPGAMLLLYPQRSLSNRSNCAGRDRLRQPELVPLIRLDGRLASANAHVALCVIAER